MAQTSSNLGDTSKDPLTLEELLIGFSNPVNEEQAWAVCYQCARYFTTTSQCKYKDLHTHGMRALRLKKDGDVFIEFSEISRGSGKGPPAKRRNSITGKDIKTVTESDAIQALGMVLFHALDYGLQESEERHLSRDLEHLLEVMINPDEDDDESQNADDEGIEKDAKEGYTFHDILSLCVKHLSNEQDAGHHYKAVCRALVAEAEELFTFLNKISSGQEKLAKEMLDEDQARLEELQRSDWARLWVQIMRELRRGVRLKKVEHTSFTPTEYELTPFEILLEDIRTRRYSLNKVMMKERVLKSPPKRDLHPREKLMLDIKSQPKLRPVRDGKLVVETSRTTLDRDYEQESPQPVKRVIKPDFHLFLDSFDESETDDSSVGSSRRSSIASPSPEKDITRWRRAVVRDTLASDCHGVITRRNSIAVCESPRKKWTHPIECLSLTLEEVTHIRTVLTKAELETLITNQELYSLVSKGKICFTCKDVKFSMFGQWGTRCKICKRNICNNCLRKMNIPTEHFENIPVHTLSPIPLSQETMDMLKAFESTGSVPPTPASERKQQLIETKTVKRKPLQRSHTISSGSQPTLPNKNLLRGPQMNVCCDCKSMIMEIIRTSRTSIALINQRKTPASPPNSPTVEKDNLNLSTLSLNIKQFFSK